MTEVFEECEGNFYKSIREAQKILRQQSVSELKLNEASEALIDAAQQVNKMEIQYSMNRKAEMKSKLDLFKQQLRNYKKQLLKHQNKLKQSLDQGSGPLFDKDEQDNNGLNNLIGAKQQMYENQAMSNEVALGIRRNNQILRKGITRMDDINNELTIAQKLLGSISKKMKKNKFILWGTLAALGLVLSLIIYSYVK